MLLDTRVPPRQRLGFQGLDSDELTEGELAVLGAGICVRSRDVGKVNAMYLFTEISRLRREARLNRAALMTVYLVHDNYKQALAAGTMTPRQVCEAAGLLEPKERAKRTR